jgi:ribosomal protection tetracycline resistance protein
MTDKIINIGILAHVDAGKTTVTEQLLFQSGALRTLGSVDKGTSITDGLSIEKERGISVRSSMASLLHMDVKVNIIDTPGHVDFCTEVERSLLATDAVVLVVSAVEGVQGHTLSLFQAIESLNLPCLIFINKIDRVGADVEAVLAEMKQELHPDCLLLQQFEKEASNDVTISSEFNPLAESTIIEAIVEQDDELMELFLEEQQITEQQLDASLVQSVSKQKIIPVLVGAAKSGLGIRQLLDNIVSYLTYVKVSIENELSAIVFKIEYNHKLGKLAYIRVFSGDIHARDVLTNPTGRQQKVAQIKSLENGKFIDETKISAGDIGIVSGLNQTFVGEIFGEAALIPESCQLTSPTLTVQVIPKVESEIIQLSQALSQLSEEDPMLDLEWLSDIRQLHIKITGVIQIEILQSLLEQRFGLQAQFSQPSVIYKETPLKEVSGYECYWMPKPCWAILKLLIQPAELGSGVEYVSKIGVNDVAAKYQKEIQQTIPSALRQGIKGWQVTDLKITLIEGQDHNVHSRAGDFIIATPMAMMNGLKESGTQLLEPYLSYVISAPLEYLSTITSEVTKMRGQFESPVVTANKFKLTGNFPVATSMDFPIKLASISSGKAKVTTKMCNYQPCTDEQGQVAEYRGVSPLDRDKWILQARGAL